MKIYGISVVQNEGDVIADSLLWAARFCEHVWAWDLGSTDDTWKRLQGLAQPNVTVTHCEWMPFMNSLRGKFYAEVKDQIEEGSWIYILDADEFLVADPRPLLAAAEQEGTAIVRAWQVNFLPTRKDLAKLKVLGEEAWTTVPLSERLRHYRVEWLEDRFVRVVPAFIWNTSATFSRWLRADGTNLRVSGRTAAVRHYRYRSPSQVLNRHRTRQTGGVYEVGQFRWTSSPDFASYVQPSWRVRHWPPGANELNLPLSEMLRARLVWTLARMVHHIQRRLRRFFH